MTRYLQPMLLACLVLAPMISWASAITLAGILGNKALLVIDGGAPRAIAAGDTHRGVKVISVQREDVTIEVDGARQNLRLGESPISVGAQNGNQRVVLSADQHGHFVSTGKINGKNMQYMVDTGASAVSIGKPDADRMGIQYSNGRRVNMHTANGVSVGWIVKLDSVRIGDIELFGVDAVITPERMPYVLLGNNFLGALQMTRNNQQMVLEKR